MGTSEINTPLYICVYLPEFPTQTLLRLRPHLADKPVAVMEGSAPFELVSSLNARAFKLGVALGMTRAELESFPELCVLRRSEAEERTARAAVLEAAGGFTPRMEVQPPSTSTSSAFVLVMDMTGTTRLFGTAQKAAASITHALASLNFYLQIAASANLQTAVCLAPGARKSAAIIPAGKERESLSRLPLSALNLTDHQAETLNLWGLRALSELAELPEVELIVRLGQEGKRLRQLARGEHPHLFVPEEPVFTLEEYLAFDAPLELLDSLLFVLGPMLDQLLTRAQNRAFALASVTVKLGLEGGAEHERTIKPALPVLQRDVLLKLLHLDLQAHPPGAGILTVALHGEPGDRSKVQLGLFAPQLPEAVRLDVTLARIAALVGEDRVGSPRLADTHKPDAFTMERFSVPAPGAPAVARQPTHSVALRRYRPPLDLTVQHNGSQLAGFYLHGKRYAIEEAYGPWRRSGDWWTADVWSREEWDIRAAAGPLEALLCILSHDLLRKCWQLEALYD